MIVSRPETPIAFVDLANLYEYYPRLIDDNVFPILFDEIRDKVARYEMRTVYGELYEAKRLSFLVGDADSDDSSGSLPWYSWTNVPTIESIRRYLEGIVEASTIDEDGRRIYKPFDYALVHLYRDGTDYINYHADREATECSVVSLSMGATRTFRFRPQHLSKGFYDSIELCSGDVVHMLPGCQRYLKHAVPKRMMIRSPRINITFRFEIEG